MPEFHKGAGGLLELACYEGRPFSEVDPVAYGWTLGANPGFVGPMAGSGIHFDRSFLAAEGPQMLLKAWTYRNYDVSTLREFACQLAGDPVTEQGQATHRAQPDIMNSINAARELAAALNPRGII